MKRFRFFVRRADGRPIPGAPVELLAEISRDIFGWVTSGGTDDPQQILIRVVANEIEHLGITGRIRIAGARSDSQGYGVVNVECLGPTEREVLRTTLRLACLDAKTRLFAIIAGEPPVERALLREKALQTPTTSVALAKLAENLENLVFGQGVPYLLEVPDAVADVVAGPPGRVVAPDAADFDHSPASFLAAADVRIGDGSCEHLVPATRPIRSLVIRRLVIRTKTDTIGKPDVEKLPSIDAVPEPINTIGWGELLEFDQTWFNLGHSLGEVRYSLALAPGEAVRIAVIDYSRTDDADRADDIHFGERLRHRQTRDRDLDNIVEGTLDENQSGGSTITGGALDFEYKPDSKFSLGGTVGSTTGTSYSAGDRDLAAEEQQNIHDKVIQRSDSLRDLTSTVVVQSVQDETNQMATRIVANMNRMHALTILYYEVLRHLKVCTALKTRRTAILAPVKPVTFDDSIVSRYRTLLEPMVPTQYRIGFDAIERLTVGDSAYASEAAEAGSSGADSEAGDTKPSEKTLCNTFEVVIVSGKHGLGDEADTWGAVTVDLVMKSGASVSIFSKPNGSANSFMALGSQHQRTSSGFQRTFTARRSIPFPVALDDVASMQVSYTSDSLSDAWNVISVAISAVLSSGIVPLVSNEFRTTLLAKAANLLPVRQDLPIVPVTFTPPPRAAKPPGDDEDDDEEETKKAAAAAALAKQPTKTKDNVARLRLLYHLQGSAIDYSLRIWLAMSPSERRLRLAGYLADAADLVGDEVIAVSGNRLALVYDGQTPDWLIREAEKDPEPTVSVTALATRGVFAEAHLGHCNAAEERDITRLWNFGELPVSLLPNIESLTAGPRGQGTVLGQGELPGSVLNIITPQAAPDPTGLANALQVLRTPEIFRNMSALQEVSATLGRLIQSAQAPSLSGAQPGAPGTGGGAGGTGAPTGQPDAGQQARALQAAKDAVDQMIRSMRAGAESSGAGPMNAFDQMQMAQGYAERIKSLGGSDQEALERFKEMMRYGVASADGGIGSAVPQTPSRLVPLSNVPLDPGNGGRSIGPAVLEIGDIILSTTTSPDSTVIRSVTGSPVSHSILYIGDNLVVESVAQGVVARPIQQSLNGASFAVALRYQGLTLDQALKIRDAAGREVGKKYDFRYAALQALFRLDLLVFCSGKSGEELSECRRWVGGINLGTGTNDKWFCSELVLSSFTDAAVALTATPASWNAPEEIVQLVSTGMLGYVGHLKTS